MSKVKVKLLKTFMHDRQVRVTGEVIEVSLIKAEELSRLNLVKIIDSDESPIGDTSVTKNLVVTPASDTSNDEQGSEETPASDTSNDEQGSEETPASDTSNDEQGSEETPASDTSNDEQASEETPVQQAGEEEVKAKAKRTRSAAAKE
ncbi:hypothetical protein [Acinetobacter lactucae]|uniref:hypothetical protein n=1 Tax=Acinetobacter lactucae TaxID=1785128 RepID=UPI00237BDF95|nr:hypothetical protein [Acinetobacter lactucae]MDD9317867.1 hypothetical protein [Acinetobacter lactucae]